MTTTKQSTTPTTDSPLADYKPFGTARIVNTKSSLFGEVVTIDRFFPPTGYRDTFERSAWCRMSDNTEISLNEKELEILEIHYWPINDQTDANPDRLKGDKHGN